MSQTNGVDCDDYKCLHLINESRNRNIQKKKRKKGFFSFVLISYSANDFFVVVVRSTVTSTYFFFFFLTVLQNNAQNDNCSTLFKLDYNVVEITNVAGELSSHYPGIILVPENEKQQPTTLSNMSNFCGFFNPSCSTAGPSSQRAQQETIYESSFDAVRLKELIIKARFARSRTRFPVPVILYKGKYVCRSSTLSGGPEMYTRTSFNYFFNGTPTKSTETDESE